MLWNILLVSATHQHDQPQAHICALPLEPHCHLPPHPVPLGWHKSPIFELPASYSRFPLAYFIYGSVHVSPLSICPTLCFPAESTVLFSTSVFPASSFLDPKLWPYVDTSSSLLMIDASLTSVLLSISVPRPSALRPPVAAAHAQDIWDPCFLTRLVKSFLLWPLSSPHPSWSFSNSLHGNPKVHLQRNIKLYIIFNLPGALICSENLWPLSVFQVRGLRTCLIRMVCL